MRHPRLVMAIAVQLAVLTGCGTTDTLPEALPDGLRAMVTASRDARTAEVLTTFEISGGAADGLRNSSAGSVDMLDRTARLELSDEDGTVPFDVVGDVLYVGGSEGIPIEGHNQLGAAVAGMPIAPLEWIERLNKTRWEPTTAGFTSSISPKEVQRVMASTAATTYTNRFASRLQDVTLLKSAKGTITVERDEGGRVRTVSLSAKAHGVTIHSETRYSSYGVAFDSPTAGRVMPHLDLLSRPHATTDVELESLIKSSSKPVVVMFGARWCPVCKMLNPSLSAASVAVADRAHVVTLDIDDFPMAGTNYAVTGVPHTFMFRNGQLVDSFVGSADSNEVMDWVTSSLD